jgi:hypothetical protein
VLLSSGAIAGPLFTIAWILEGATRPDYDPFRHPISSLAIGELGWTQIIVFIATGLLMVGFALGVRTWLRLHGGSKWGSVLLGLIGIGLIGAGIFVTDPINGYPPGTPNFPQQFSVAGRLHRLFSAFVFIGLPGACFAFARFFAKQGVRRWMVYSAFSGIAFLILFFITTSGFARAAGLGDSAGLFQRLTLTIGWLWVTLLAVHLLRSPDAQINSTDNLP